MRKLVYIADYFTIKIKDIWTNSSCTYPTIFTEYFVIFLFPKNKTDLKRQ